MRFLFVLFVVLPVIEMVVLIKVGSLIGVLNTVALVLLTAILGAALLRQQGLATLLRANQRLNSGELPAKEVAEGLILAVGGALLLTPGFVTDAIGFACLLPVTRNLFVRQVIKHLVVVGGGRSGTSFGSGFSSGPFSQGRSSEDPFSRNPFSEGPFSRPSSRSSDDNDVIEGEYSRTEKREDRRVEKK